ncbi:MAG: hypothetical protein WAM66_08925 [Acidobacteriaceae bacterium]
MPELLEDEKSEKFDLGRYLGIIRRRHMHFLIPLLAGWLLVWGASWILPVRYKSSTLILVEQPTMPKNYVMPNINDNLQNRLQSITEQILSRTRLLLIIDKWNLYRGGRHHLTPDGKVDQMRKDTTITLVRNSQDDTINAFTIDYSAADPHVAQEVTNDLSQLFIGDNLKVRQRESQNTTNFIENQLADARASLAQQEAAVRAFQGQHEGDLPSQQASNLQILSGLQGQLQSEQDALNTAKQQQVYFQTLTDQYKALHTSTPTAGNAPPALLALDQQISNLKSQLANLRSRYTERYPDVQNAEGELARTEKSRDQMVAELRRNGGLAAHAAGASADGTNLLQLEGQLKSNELEIANRTQAVKSLQARIDEYQGRLNATPASEQQLADLTRGYEQSKANFDDLLKKKNDSQMATSMEQMQEGERFSVLDPPNLPLKPDFPNRLKFCGLGVLVGLALGIASVVVFEFMDDRLHDEKDIIDLLPVRILSEVPEVLTPADLWRSRRSLWFGWATAVLVAGVILCGSMFSYLKR